MGNCQRVIEEDRGPETAPKYHDTDYDIACSCGETFQMTQGEAECDCGRIHAIDTEGHYTESAGTD